MKITNHSSIIPNRYERMIKMNTKSHKQPLALFLVALTALALSSLACSIGGVTLGNNSALVDITLNQDEINQFLNRVQFNRDYSQDRLLDKVSSIEMHDGFIRVFGSATQPDGSVVNGSYDVSFAAENDLLKVQIIAVDVPGVELSDPRIVKTNQEITDGLTQSVRDSNGDVQYKEASVKDGVLKMKVQVNFK
jgi:hypothetical protein